MYFPYLRGKQYELIALREISSQLGSKVNVHPVIEPIKRNDTGLIRTCNDLTSSNVPFTIIINPKVGEVQGHGEELLNFIDNQTSKEGPKYLGVLVEGEQDINNVLMRLKACPISFKGFNLIHLRPLKDFTILSGLDPYGKSELNTINFSGTNRRYDRNFAKATIVTLSDPFNLQNRNADYSRTPDEPFTAENKYFKEDNYYGFSDYLTIGEPFSASGFLPYAVAIHITYEDSGFIRIRHFVSDSNDDYSDVPGKFMEALQKLVDWLTTSSHNTRAIAEFQRLYRERHFPGLGTIKKLSILNHIELINRML